LGGRGAPSKRLTIGKHGVLTPDQARKDANEQLVRVDRGVDVAQARKEERDKLTGLTFRDMVERFLLLEADDTRYWREKRARLLSADTKAICDRPFALIARQEIASVVTKVQARSNASARLLFADIRPIFSWGLDQGAIESNPMIGMRGPSVSPARDRVLTGEELKAFWQTAGTLGAPFDDFFKLLLLTAQRREEVAGMHWREIDLEAATWTIPKERCKNGKEHTVDLCPEAARLLQALEPDRGTEGFVFTTIGSKPVSGFSKAKLRIDKRMKAILGARFQPWRAHDLRRTAASGMAALGFQPHVIERVLNHVSGVQGGLVGVYQRHEYRDERKQAVVDWGSFVGQLVRP
jgi:integrase